MMNILYITSSFHKKGSASIRNLSLVNGLVEVGANVDVLTQYWPQGMTDQDLIDKTNNNVSVHYDYIKIIDLYFSKVRDTRQSQSKFKISNFFKKIIKYFYYFPDIDKEWIYNFNKDLNYRKYDLIISSSDTKTSHLVAKKVCEMHPHLEWFQIWGDPWVDDEGTNGVRKIMAYFYEKRLIKSCKKVFYTSNPTCISQKNKYKNSSDKMYYLGRSYINEVINENVNSQDEKIIFSYIGSIYYGRNIKPLILSIQKFNLQNNNKIYLNIYGIINQELNNEYTSDEYINFLGEIQYSQVEQVIKGTDILVFMSNYSTSHQIPGKLFDYFGTNLPILALVESLDNDVSKFIVETNRCIVYQNSEKTINLNKIINETKKNTFTPLANYSKKNIANKLLEHL